MAAPGLPIRGDHDALQHQPDSFTVSHILNGCMPTLQAAGAAWQHLDEADGETAADAGD
jgi:hypothetical protein